MRGWEDVVATIAGCYLWGRGVVGPVVTKSTASIPLANLSWPYGAALTPPGSYTLAMLACVVLILVTLAYLCRCVVLAFVVFFCVTFLLVCSIFFEHTFAFFWGDGENKTSGLDV